MLLMRRKLHLGLVYSPSIATSTLAQQLEGKVGTP